MGDGPAEEILVVGAGVVGLTTATVLTEAGLRVRVVAKDKPSETVSARAGAIWNPHLVDHPKLTEWWRRSLRRFDDLARQGFPGVTMADGLEEYRHSAEKPAWIDDARRHRDALPDELHDGFHCGWVYEAPLIDMPRYLDALSSELRDAGVPFHWGSVITSLRELPDRCTIINCTGLGAGSLVGDRRIRPVRGQLVVVENPGIDRFYIDGDGMACIFPHADTVVLGGSEHPDRVDMEVDPVVAERIRRECVAVEPRLRDARVLGHRVGLRPQRDRVRVEWDPELGVIHNYGHGGAGVTLSWGCAGEVLRLLRDDEQRWSTSGGGR